MQCMACITLDTAGRRSHVEQTLPAEQVRVRELMQQGVLRALYIPDGAGAPDRPVGRLERPGASKRAGGRWLHGQMQRSRVPMVEATVVNDVSARRELKTGFGPLTRLFPRAHGTRESLRLRVCVNGPERAAVGPPNCARQAPVLAPRVTAAAEFGRNDTHARRAQL